MSRHNRLLFVLKLRDVPDDPYGCDDSTASLVLPADGITKPPLSSGLRNSVTFMVDMLNGLGIHAKLVEVHDMNDIDREVYAYKPTHCILEACWVAPWKIRQLKPLHPNVKWIVRVHSETPFLSQEAWAYTWLIGCMKLGVEIMCNAPRMQRDMRIVATTHGFNDGVVTYGPNYYPVPFAGHIAAKQHNTDDVINIGCFGAFRPLKNHLVQALAALNFARSQGRRLLFHVNASRVEMGGSAVLRNLLAMFDGIKGGHELVQHPWISHNDFLLLLNGMDVSCQASLSETFNIVLADSVVCNVPVIGTSEIPWLGGYAIVDPLSSQSIQNALTAVWLDHHPGRRLQWQRNDLSRYSDNSRNLWNARFGQ